MKKFVISILILLVLTLNLDVALARNLDKIIDNINSEKKIIQIVGDLNIKPSDFKASAVIKISNDKFNALIKNRATIARNIAILETELLNNKISDEEINEIILKLTDNISVSSSAKNFIEILKFKILENKLPQSVLKTATNLTKQYTEFHGESKRWIIPAVIAVAGAGGILIGGSQYSAQSHQHATQPNITNDDGSITIVPDSNHGENITNADGSVTMVPYNHDGTQQP